MSSNNVGLTTPDYVVTAAMLFIPLAIGVFFAVKDAKRATREEYLLGGRRMSMLPVALSLFATFASAISLMGVPTEVYYNGAMHPTFQLGFAAAYLLSLPTMIPLIYPLRITSIYEFLYLRYQSKAVRNFALIISMLQTFFYMAVALLTPALGLQTAAGIPLWVSIIIVGLVGTIYTAIGGIKSVVWTDAFQCCVMFTGIILMMWKGVLVIGGFDKAWAIAADGGRTNFVQFSPDPRSKYTWWGTIIGGCFMWLTNIFSQSTVQRICAVRSIRDAKIAYVVNIILFCFYGTLLFLVGVVIYSYFYHIQCDPYQAGFITNKNQLPLYFVLHVLQDLPGASGVYMSCIFSGALSTLSSGMNALAANTVEDILKDRLKNFSEQKTTLITKLIVLVYGVLIIAVAYLARHLAGSVAQMALSVFGACGGPILGVFLLGAIVPWGNKYGALVGATIALAFNLWISIGGHLYGRKHVPLELPTTEMCYVNVSNNIPTHSVLMNVTIALNTTKSLNSFDSSFFLYDISYEWYGCYGTVISFVLGLLVSRCTYKLPHSTPNAKLTLSILKKYWSLPSESNETTSLDKNLEVELQVKS